MVELWNDYRSGDVSSSFDMIKMDMAASNVWEKEVFSKRLQSFEQSKSIIKIFPKSVKVYVY